ncbi:hypothetical protein [Sphingobacterium hotanense]|uniref:DUF4468 domain-containing protein n=1 Tax=Sphingobacterium hotanense TaxID=649196 RepID=A0ABT7NLF7_9SPHI|nr:hypothetical protein [Sphingobacterium hotanense]MDM1048044.1 hypothetical protein [Sphingobacterium hotanense]
MKTILIFLFTTLVHFSIAQIQLTPNGFRDQSDTSKMFSVIDLKNQSHRHLYQISLVRLQSPIPYCNKVSVKVSEDKAIIAEGESIPLFAIGMSKIYAKFTVAFMFKDGKMKYEVLRCDYDAEGAGGVRLNLKGEGKKNALDQFIWSSGDILIHPDAKRQTEFFFNNLLSEVLKAVQEWEKW